ncbi:MAG: heparinase II/III family protein [Bacteroidaceae bacterium]|nr:heparinase II/III family protein [Bacteroidaceae bacterium]
MEYHRKLFGFIIFYWIFCGVCVKAQSQQLSKSRASFYTENKVNCAAENIRQYAWACEQKNQVMKRADKWLADFQNDLGRLWDLLPSQAIPRSFAVNSLHGCLACGDGINKFGNYSYLYDKGKMDWKLTCPNCHLVFPTNDFKAYYEGGLERDGRFNPQKAEQHNKELIKAGGKGNLINLYTLKGLTEEQKQHLKEAGVSDSLFHRIITDPSWGVDNGMGYRFNPKDKVQYGNPYTYVAYYTHWVLWYWRVMPMLDDFSRAYLLTCRSDDSAERAKSQKYADAAIVLLDRVADLYPDLRLDVFPRNGYYGFPNSGEHFDTHQSAGRVVGSVWENTFIKSVLLAYDAVFPAIDSTSASARKVLVERSGLLDKGNTQTMKLHLENGILREVPKAYADGDLQGNPGMHQSSLALAAVVIDHEPETAEWLNVVYRNGACDWHDVGKRDGGCVMRYMINRINRDGEGDEISLGYNSGWLSNWLFMAKALDGYHIPDGKTLDGNMNPDLLDNPRYKNLFLKNPVLLTDQYAAHIGDTGLTGQPDFSPLSVDDLIYGYQHYHDPYLARVIYLIKKKQIKDIHADIFTKNPENIQQEIEATIKKYGAWKMPSENRTAYGLAMLRDSLRTLWMFYGDRCASHNHADPLNIGYIAYGLDLMPDFGYPNTLGGSLNPEQQWDKSTPAHNTVSYDPLGYMGHIVGYGKPLHFDSFRPIQLIQVVSNKVQNSGIHFFKNYQRTVALIRVDSENAYIADFFHVNCPASYTYNFHTAEVDTSATHYKNLSFSNNCPVTYNRKTLRQVRAAKVCGSTFHIDWNIRDTWNVYGRGSKANTDVHVGITMPCISDSIRVGEAVPPTNVGENPASVPIVMVPGKAKTVFLAVIDGYRGHSKIVSVETVPVKEGDKLADSTEVRAMKIRLSNGRTDYIVEALNRQKKYWVDGKFDFRGFFAFYSLDGQNKCLMKYLNDGTLLDGKTFVDRITGTVTDATNKLSEHNYLVIRTHQKVNAAMLKDKFIYVNNDDIPDTEENEEVLKYNAVYQIRSAKYESRNTFRLDLGNCSIVRGLKDLNDNKKGFLRDFNLGTNFYIPLSFKEWK